VLRGGSWNNNARNCRSANRNRNEPANRNNNNGFRVCFSLHFRSSAKAAPVPVDSRIARPWVRKSWAETSVVGPTRRPNARFRRAGLVGASRTPGLASFAMSSELNVIRDGYSLTVELARRVEKFPRHHRSGLGDDLSRSARAILAGLIRTKYAAAPNKLPLLVDINLALELLRFELRLAVDLRVLPVSAHGQLIRMAETVGSQVGGWMRSMRPSGGVS